MERRLAAIVAADIIGYSRLIGLDEDGTLQQLRTLRRDMIEPAIADNQGRIVKFLGDGFLAEFSSVSAALAASLRIQHDVAAHNEDVPEERRIRHRIGINQGEIVIEEGDIFGDTVNIASRLEGFASPEGIAVSEKVYDEVSNKLEIDFEDLGLQQLKNIRSPVRIYRTSATHDGPPRQIVGRARQTVEGRLDASADLRAGKPSIAVLPFQNMSGDEEQEYFADGVTEDIITALSRVRWLFVVARNSTFAYRNQSPDIREVGRDLGARYVLEGSVRKSGDRVRITSQLIDAGTGNHVWADRYDRVLEDIFALQDEISETIAARIEPELGYAERDRAQHRATEDLGAWDLYQRAMWHLYRFTPGDAKKARSLFHQSIEADPDFPSPHTGLAYQQLYDVMNGYSDDPEASLVEAEENVRKALELDDKDALARFTLGRLYALKLDYEASIREFERGIQLNPGFAQIYHGLGFVLAITGQAREAIPYFEKAIRLSPHDPHLTSFMAMRAFAYLTLNEYEKAVDSAEGAIAQPNAMVWPRIFRTSALGNLGDPAAKASLRDLLNYMPEISSGRIRSLMYYVQEPEIIDHILHGLAEAGLPD